MPDYTGAMDVIKRAAVEAVEAGSPTGIYFGKVLSTSPIQINVDQKMTLGPAQLVLSRNVTDYSTAIETEWETTETQGGSGENAFALHSHRVTGAKLTTIYNGLAVGDQVILMRQQGGQKYIVLDKVG